LSIAPPSVPRRDARVAGAKLRCNQLVNEILMTGMNRLSPLIVRRVGRFGPTAMAMPMPEPMPFAGAEHAQWLDDLRLFATGWVGGLIFFGTLLG
jgi:hypothetical protein